MKQHTHTLSRAGGFTLVELLVAMALIIFIMSILSAAFAAAAKSFRDLKAANDLAEKLRGVSGLLRRDLGADHFDGRRRLSQPDFWAAGPPSEGFFRLYQTSGAAGLEGNDIDGIPLYLSEGTTANHCLHFTVKFRGNHRSDFLVADGLTNSPVMDVTLESQAERARRYQETLNKYQSQWAEVVYFMRPAIDPATNNQERAEASTPLWSLYRRQRLCVVDRGFKFQAIAPLPVPGQPPGYTEVSCHEDSQFPGFLYFNDSADLTLPGHRLQMSGTTYPTMGDEESNLKGADLLLTDVISWDVRVMLANGSEFVTLDHPSVQAFNHGNPQFNGSGRPFVFDTWSRGVDNLYDFSEWNKPNTATSIPLYRPSGTTTDPIRFKAIQITIRAWDFKASVTRQATIVQEL